MVLKLDENRSATAFHINDGPFVFPYAIDAQHAISNHPLEWSDTPWRAEDAAEARKQLADRYATDVEDAKARGLPEPPPPPPEPPPLSPEDQAAVDEHNKAVAEAAERLKAYYAKKEAERIEADQVAMDEKLVASLPPAPDPNIRRPLTPAQIRKRAAETDDERAARERAEAEKKAADDKVVQDKANEDRLAGNPPRGQPAPAPLPPAPPVAPPTPPAPAPAPAQPPAPPPAPATPAPK